MRILGLDDVRNSSGELLCSCKSIVVLNKDNQSLGSEVRRTDCFLVVFCTEGEFFMRINTKVHSLSSDTFAFILPNSIIQPIENEKKERKQVIIVAFETSLLSDAIDLKRKMWKMGHYLYLHPTVLIDESKAYKAYLYRELLLNLFHETNRPYGEERLHLIVLAAFSEIMTEYDQMITLNKFKDKRIPKGRNVFQKFMESVMCDDGTHRSVSYYADCLGYSSKHLSTVVKEVSGKTPLEIINKHAIEQIKYVLKHTDLTMKEVSDHFKFSNASFFGKFVKAHIGMSPQVYRFADMEEEE